MALYWTPGLPTEPSSPVMGAWQDVNWAPPGTNVPGLLDVRPPQQVAHVPTVGIRFRTLAARVSNRNLWVMKLHAVLAEAAAMAVTGAEAEAEAEAEPDEPDTPSSVDSWKICAMFPPAIEDLAPVLPDVLSAQAFRRAASGTFPQLGDGLLLDERVANAVCNYLTDGRVMHLGYRWKHCGEHVTDFVVGGTLDGKQVILLGEVMADVHRWWEQAVQKLASDNCLYVDFWHPSTPHIGSCSQVQEDMLAFGQAGNEARKHILVLGGCNFPDGLKPDIHELLHRFGCVHGCIFVQMGGGGAPRIERMLGVDDWL